jgi:hypothetical protein
MRRMFVLPEEDAEFLNSTGLHWETLIEAGLCWLILRDYPICEGYSVTKVNAALIIGSMYPTEQIDMVYFSPALSRLDGKEIRALSNQQIDGQNWQRWSRHRTAQNPWRPGLDNISTHITAVDNWLVREFKLVKNEI